VFLEQTLIVPWEQLRLRLASCCVKAVDLLDRAFAEPSVFMDLELARDGLHAGSSIDTHGPLSSGPVASQLIARLRHA